MLGPLNNLAGPPRGVPLLVRLRLMLGGYAQIWWLVLAFAMILACRLHLPEAVATLFRFSGPIDRTTGSIVRVEETFSGEDDHPIFAYHYEFSMPGPQANAVSAYEAETACAKAPTHNGASYAHVGTFRVGQPVMVEFPPGRPNVSRIVGTTSTPGGSWDLLAGVFPLISLVFVVLGIRRGLRGIRLLRDGQQTMARLLSVQSTNVKVNEQTVFKYTFEFRDSAGAAQRVTAKTHVTSRFAGEDMPGRRPGDDGVYEPVIYDPLNPSRAVLLDALPGGPRIDETGQVRAGNPVTAMATAIIPLATLIGHGIYLLSRLR
jgi:hypothetical protein